MTEDPREMTPETIAAAVEALPELRSEAVRLASELPGTPQHLRVETAGSSLEIDWDTTAAPPAPPAVSPDSGSSSPKPEGHPIAAPLVGTFYRSSGPGEEPFVQVGDVVTAGQQVAIVEAMKLMNAVEAERPGTVTAVLVEDGEMVEFGQPLLVLDTDGNGS
ncbi:acetyl-CoA carboxylase biotin carboxyl carrier protein [Lentzea sp. E54]|uniref:acetyl-CoA carboxylase biotin carboxyl carrier protein n=1 Tax=Lentzea xerophila TaxID=3435883 RepID=UPI003DA523CE